MNTVNSSMYDLNNFDFMGLNSLSKIVMIIFMIIGRVELLTILIIIKNINHKLEGESLKEKPILDMLLVNEKRIVEKL